jgi:hypothetical protein
MLGPQLPLAVSDSGSAASGKTSSSASQAELLGGGKTALAPGIGKDLGRLASRSPLASFGCGSVIASPPHRLRWLQYRPAPARRTSVPFPRWLLSGAAGHRELVVAFQGFDAFAYALQQVVDGTGPSCKASAALGPDHPSDRCP